MRKALAAAAVAVAVVPMGACSSSDDGPATNAHGMIDKAIGQDATVTDGDTLLLTFRVNNIATHVNCPNDPPPAGQWVTVDISAETTADAASHQGQLQSALSPANWSAYKASGERLSNIYKPVLCSPPPNWADSLPPSSKFTGAVTIDLPQDVTSISIPIPASHGGWEWQVPSNS